MANEDVNTFEQMAQEKAKNAAPVAETSKSKNTSNELTLDDFSNTAIGDKVKYTRPDLGNTQDVVDKFQVFMPDLTTEPKDSRTGDSQYWQPTVLLTFASVNSDGVQNREYISGAKIFKQNNGDTSKIQFWYEGSETQIAKLWELVAKAKGLEADRLSTREFIAFLNNKPKVEVENADVKNFSAEKGAPKTVKKNLIKGFL